VDLDRLRRCRRFSLVAALLALAQSATPTMTEQNHVVVTPNFNTDRLKRLAERAYPVSAFCRRQGTDDNAGFDKTERVLALMGIAFACLREGKPLQALAVFSEIIGHVPLNDQALLNRGTLHVKLGLVDEGIADYSMAVRLTLEGVSVAYLVR
jgi:hypothetical protein